MAQKQSKEKNKKAFFELAEEIEKSCGDWKSLPKDEELIKRIIIAVSEKNTNDR